jgi:hypothetical protein
MKSEILNRITKCDETLKFLGKSLAASGEEEKHHWTALIDNTLDERLRLMAERDGHTSKPIRPVTP